MALNPNCVKDKLCSLQIYLNWASVSITVKWAWEPCPVRLVWRIAMVCIRRLHGCCSGTLVMIYGGTLPSKPSHQVYTWHTSIPSVPDSTLSTCLSTPEAQSSNCPISFHVKLLLHWAEACYELSYSASVGNESRMVTARKQQTDMGLESYQQECERKILEKSLQQTCLKHLFYVLWVKRKNLTLDWEGGKILLFIRKTLQKDQPC